MLCRIPQLAARPATAYSQGDWPSFIRESLQLLIYIQVDNVRSAAASNAAAEQRSGLGLILGLIKRNFKKLDKNSFVLLLYI
jgi:hypothetical protein